MPHLYEWFIRPRHCQGRRSSTIISFQGKISPEFLVYQKHVRVAPRMYPSLAGWPLLLLLPGCLIDGKLPTPGNVLQIVILILALVATARLCRGSFNVTRLEDVESLFQGCTHVRGDITITDTYSGALILPNLKTIDGKLDVQYITSRPGMGNSTPTQITSLELPDTQSIKNVAIANITTLKTISMPRLESVSHFAIYQHGITTDTLDLRSLREASYFYLAGGFSRYGHNTHVVVIPGNEY